MKSIDQTRFGASGTVSASGGGYAGPKLRGGLNGMSDWLGEIIERSDVARGFEVLPRRWGVKTSTWLWRCRGLAKDWEASIGSAEAWSLIAHTRIMIRPLARCHAAPVQLCVGL
jgi:hypothetical protein